MVTPDGGGAALPVGAISKTVNMPTDATLTSRYVE
jgi:hypothetical protein